jgi:hypothetical protein
MSVINAFQPQGSTFLVGTSAVQITSSTGACCYRVRNLAAAAQYFTWGNSSSVTSNGAPSAGNPSANTVGLAANGIEIYQLPGNVWMIASSATGFEVTPGEGV